MEPRPVLQFFRIVAGKPSGPPEDKSDWALMDYITSSSEIRKSSRIGTPTGGIGVEEDWSKESALIPKHSSGFRMTLEGSGIVNTSLKTELNIFTVTNWQWVPTFTDKWTN